MKRARKNSFGTSQANKVYWSLPTSWLEGPLGSYVDMKDCFLSVRPKRKRDKKAAKIVQAFLNYYIQSGSLYQDAIRAYRNNLLYGIPMNPDDYYAPPSYIGNTFIDSSGTVHKRNRIENL